MHINTHTNIYMRMYTRMHTCTYMYIQMPTHTTNNPGLPGHVFINADFTEILLRFCVIKTNRPDSTAKQQLETSKEEMEGM